MKTLITFFLIAASAAWADFRAGVARVIITPETPIWMAGYLSRNKPFEGVVHDLWAKALAIEDPTGRRVVIVTTDLIEFPRAIYEVVAARVQKQYQLERAALLLNSSHTHTGPLLERDQYMGLDLLSGFNEHEGEKVQAYGRKLTDDIVSLVGSALGKLSPADLSFGEGEVGFAVNRRQQTPEGKFRIGINLEGPTDHSVPVLKVTDAKGRLLAVLFGYACHNTTLTTEFFKICGDYAGFAQIELEKAHSGATAMFLMLCGGDQNPNPRGWGRRSVDLAWTLEVAEQHGKSLAKEVDRILAGRLRPLKAPIRVAFQTVELGFVPYPRDTLEQWAAGSSFLRASYARRMLRTYDEGRPPIRQIPYPVQAVRFDKSLTLVSLGGEVVVDYALRIKREYTGEKIVVAGYSNYVMAYIPSLRVLKEGGYEAGDGTAAAYGLPGPFNEKVEEVIFNGIHQVMKKVGRKQGTK